MAKVKIKNVCKDQCVGFSFKSLKPNQTTVVEEELVTEADRRLLGKEPPLATMEPWDGEIDKAPVKRDITIDDKPKEQKPPQEIITDDSKVKAPDEIVTVDDMKPIHEVNEDEATDSADNSDDDTREEAPAEGTTESPPATEETTAYTREDLEGLGRDELREIAAPLGVKGRAVEKLIEDILEAQGNQGNAE